MRSLPTSVKVSQPLKCYSNFFRVTYNYMHTYIHTLSWLVGVFNHSSVNINHKIPLTSDSGTVLVEYQHVTMIHMLYTIVCGCAIIVFAG